MKILFQCKGQKETRRGKRAKSRGLKDDGMDGEQVEKIILQAKSSNENDECKGERRVERQKRKSSSPLSCLTQKI